MKPNAYRVEVEEHDGAPFPALVIWDREPTTDDIARFYAEQRHSFLGLGKLLAGPAPDGTFVYAAEPLTLSRFIHEGTPPPPGKYTAEVKNVTLVNGVPVIRFALSPKPKG